MVYRYNSDSLSWGRSKSAKKGVRFLSATDSNGFKRIQTTGCLQKAASLCWIRTSVPAIQDPHLRWVAFNLSANKGTTNICQCLVIVIKTNKVFVGVYRGLSCIINSAKLEEHKLIKWFPLPLKYMSDEGFEPPISHEKQVLSLSP